MLAAWSVFLNLCFHLGDVSRDREFLLTQCLLQPDFRCVLVFRALKSVVYQLRLVPMSDLIFGCFAVEKHLDLACRGACMAFEGSADVDDQSVVVDELATDDGWGGSGHAADVGVVVAAVFSCVSKSLECFAAARRIL
jgi:hypothetical protein